MHFLAIVGFKMWSTFWLDKIVIIVRGFLTSGHFLAKKLEWVIEIWALFQQIPSVYYYSHLETLFYRQDGPMQELIKSLTLVVSAVISNLELFRPASLHFYQTKEM